MEAHAPDTNQGIPDVPPTLAQVYRQHADFVWRVARRLGVHEEALEDVMHEVFLVVQRRLPEYDGRAAMTTWLFHLTRGVVSNDRRRRFREQRRLEVVGRTELPRPPDPEGVAARREAADFVRGFLAGLDEDKRLVFELVDIEGMPVPEVAKLCDIKLNTAYSRLRAARSLLTEALRAARAHDDTALEIGGAS